MVDPYYYVYGQSFFPNSINAWNGLAKDISEANISDLFKSKTKLQTKLDFIYANPSANIYSSKNPAD